MMEEFLFRENRWLNVRETLPVQEKAAAEAEQFLEKQVKNVVNALATGKQFCILRPGKVQLQTRNQGLFKLH